MDLKDRVLLYGGLAIGILASLVGSVLAVIAVCLLGAGGAFAAPSISGTSGTWSHGGAVTISGSSFGTKSPAAPLLWDNGQYATLSAAGWYGWWPNTGPAGAQLQYSTGTAGVVMPHARVSKYITGAHEGTTGFDAGYNVAAWVDFAKSNGMGVYANYYHRVNPNWDAGIGSPADGNFKTIGYSVCCTIYELPNNWYLASFFNDPASDTQYIITDDNGSLQNPDANGDNAFHENMVSPGKAPASDASKWVKNEYEMVITNATGFGGGFVRIYDNGVLGVNYVGRTDNMAGTSRVFGVGGYSRDYGSADNRRFWAGVYIDTTLARVVLCEGSSYATRGRCEPQIPSAWSASSISVSVNAGRFADSATAYLYVCDSAASCNSTGTAIVIAAGGGDTTPPTVPGPLTCNSTSSAQIQCSWTASTDSGGSGLVGYDLQRCTMHGCAAYTIIASPTANSFVDTVPSPTAYQYRVRARDGAGNTSAYGPETAVAAPADAPFRMGVSTPVEFRTTYTPAERAQLLDSILAMCGIGCPVRFDLTHSTACPDAPPAGCTWGNYDTIIGEITARGLEPWPIALSSPAWNRHASCTANAEPTDHQVFADWVGAAVARYGFKWIEIWNEPNLKQFWCDASTGTQAIDSTDFVDLLKRSYVTAKTARPSIVVVTGGTAWTSTALPDSRAARGWIQDLYANGGKHYYDCYGHHPYVDTSRPPATPFSSEPGTGWMEMDATGTNLRGVMTSNGDAHKRICATEWGIPSGGTPSVTEAQQAADWVTSGFQILAGKTWSGPSMWYAMRDPCATATDLQCNYGLLRRDWSAKPAWSAFQAEATTAVAGTVAGQSSMSGSLGTAIRVGGAASAVANSIGAVVIRAPAPPGFQRIPGH